jgi:CDGSH-type Zn-finger protein
MSRSESADPLVEVTDNGPYRVEGGIPVRAPNGSPIEAPRKYFLCRCAHSSNKPFCDGTHWYIGFKAG